MKILHTADVHLHSNHPRRLEALQKIVDRGRDEEIDLLLIAGDLFDDHHQAEQLRGEIRKLFSNLPYKVLAIPGNHDEQAFSQETFYGNNFTALTQRPCTIRDFDQWRIVAVPYSQGSFAQLVQPLQEAADPEKHNILVLHCTWSLPHFTSEDYGGDELRYLPVTEATLTDLGYDYILAGHFHTSYRQRELSCGAIFVYPGSPVSVSSREQGPRSVNIVDEQGCRQLLLDTWYSQTLSYRLNLDNTQAVLDKLAQDIRQHPQDQCDLKIKISGYLKGDEEEFHRRLLAIANRRHTKVENQSLSANQIFADPLFQRFRHRLNQVEASHREEIETMLLDTFSQLLAEGK